LYATLRSVTKCVGVIDNTGNVVIMSNMKATLLLKERHAVNKQAFAELLVWKVFVPLRGSAHLFKYSLAYIVLGECVLRYDNERGKGDHRHIGDVETPYPFSTPARLLADFWADVDNWSPS
jgi:hypothetical protein